MTLNIPSEVETMIKTSGLNEKQKSVVLEFFKSLKAPEINKLYALLITDPKNLQIYADFVEGLVSRKNENLTLEEIETVVHDKLTAISE
jgi:hypothetical protein